MRRVNSGEATPMNRIAKAMVDENHALAAGGIGQGAILFDGDFTERDALIGPQ